MIQPIYLKVNGNISVLDIGPDVPLLYVLRNDLALNGPKFGCGLGECGACTVIIDGVAARSCSITAGQTEGSEITTLEGLGTADKPHDMLLFAHELNPGWEPKGAAQLMDVRGGLDGTYCRL